MSKLVTIDFNATGIISKVHLSMHMSDYEYKQFKELSDSEKMEYLKDYADRTILDYDINSFEDPDGNIKIKKIND
jgi:hypothetical protein